jgi:hypothetical protein
MKSLLVSFVFAWTVLLATAQTTLPTSWDFATTPSPVPTGWNTNTTASYSSGLPDNSGGTSRAGKLQSTGHHFTIHFYDEAATVTYFLRAYSSNGANFSGVFRVEESANGSTWSTLAEYNDDDFGNSWTEFSDSPASASRYLRFFFTDKISGINVGLDDVSIAETAPTEQEINVQYGGVDVPNNTGISFASGIGDPLSIQLIVENLGSIDTLHISGTNFSGAASGDYTVLSAPTTVAPLASETLSISFTPASAGSRVADLSIANNDASENPYIITLNGIGGNYASEPVNNPSNSDISLLKTFRVKAEFTASDAEHYLVLFRKNNSIGAEPTDGVSYQLGEGLGDAKVAYVGDETLFWLKEATANDTFHIRVYAFNGSGAFTNYKQSNPLNFAIITPKRTTQLGDYYAGIDASSTDFIGDLHDLINPHSVRYYSNYGPDMIPRFVARDTTDGKEVVTGIYSGDLVVYAPPFGWPETGMNREHTLPASWMPSVGSTSTPEYQDYHHLFPAVATANSQRSNEPLGEVVNVTSSYGAGKRGTDAFGNTVYEPRNEQKGDAARALFYMMTAYHDPIGAYSWALLDLNSPGPDQRLDVLLKWHMEDLPGGFEQARNDYLDSLQGNRNPFIDSAQWACYINFKTMGYIAEPDSACLLATMPASPIPNDTNDTLIGLPRHERSNEWLYFPNPTRDRVYLSNENGLPFSVRLYDLRGVIFIDTKLQSDGWIDLNGCPSGAYILELYQTGQEVKRMRLLKH